MTSRCPLRWGGEGELKKGGKRGKIKENVTVYIEANNDVTG